MFVCFFLKPFWPASLLLGASKGRGIDFWMFFLFCFFFVFRGFWLLASVASGFCGFWLSWLSWLLWLLAFVAFGFLAYPSMSLYLSIYLSIYLSFFLLAAVLLSLFVFAFPVVFVAETKPNKEASKHELLTFGSGVLLGGALRPPQPPPRHEICTSSPTPAPATKSIF